MTFVVFAKQLGPILPGIGGTLATLGKIAWPWYVLIGTTVTMAVGIASSFTHGEPPATDNA